MDAAAIACFFVAAWLLLGEPLLGRWSHRRLLAALNARQAGARLRFYQSWTAMAWVLAALVALVAWAAGWSPAALGLRLPQAVGVSGDFLAGVIGPLIAGLVIGLALARRSKRRNVSPTRSSAARPRVPGGDRVLRMLPHTRAERWGFAALAITAGLTEEWIWRGFGAALVHQAWPSLPLAPTVLVLALAFGWAHLYQGLAGVLATALLGGLFAWLFFATGSLLLPMALHVLVDLRALLLPTGAAASAQKHAIQTSIRDQENP